MPGSQADTNLPTVFVPVAEGRNERYNKNLRRRERRCHMWSFVLRLLSPRARRRYERRERERIAEELGLFADSGSKIVHDAGTELGVTETDNLRFGNLGAPRSSYYEDQTAAEFQKDYARIQGKTERLLKSLPPRDS